MVNLQNRKFSSEDRDWLSTFANQAALAFLRTEAEELRAKLLNRLEKIGTMTLQTGDQGLGEFQKAAQAV